MLRERCVHREPEPDVGKLGRAGGDSSRVIAVPADKVIRSRINAEREDQPSAFGELFGSELLPDVGE
jgi:hypothetical protein